MAQREDDREDLMKEATALDPRVEWQVDAMDESVVAGLKKDGSFSIYFGQNPTYQFNEHGQLRRAWFDGCLYRTQGSTLAQLTRSRTQDKTELLRVDLDESELAMFMQRMDSHLRQLQDALRIGAVAVVQVIETRSELPDFVRLIDRVFAATPRLAKSIVVRR